MKSTYNKREVDSRLRVLNEKEVALQTTSPATYVVAGIYVLSGQAGKGYERGQTVTTANGQITATIEETDGNGGIVRLSWDEAKVYGDNLETVSPGTVEADDQDEFGDEFKNPVPVPNENKTPVSYIVLSPKIGTAYTYVRVVTRYAPGDYPAYGALGRSGHHDPLVQTSYMTGYVDKKLEDAVVMTFVGYVSKDDPNDKLKHPLVMVKAGDLWYTSDVAPVVTDSTSGDIAPESALLDTTFPWGKHADAVTKTGELYRWNGQKWQGLTGGGRIEGKYADGYTPEKLDIWETLNVTADKNRGDVRQNTGFYWLDQWKLYTFSVDETLFMHLRGNETVNRAKTFTTDITLPAKLAAATKDVTTHPASEHQVYLAVSGAGTALTNHKNAATIDHPDSSVTTAKIADNSVTDGKIGNRTLSAATATDTETTTASMLTALLQSLSNRIKALLDRFNTSGGHDHDGTDSPKVAYANVTGTPGVVSKTANGLAPQLPNETTTTKYLRQDGSWVVPPDNNTTYGIVSKTANGLAPQLPNEVTTTKYLRQDGSWVVPPDNNTTYGIVSKTANGLAPQLPNEVTTTKYLRQDCSWTVPPDNNTTYSEMSGTALGLVKLNGSYTFTGTINVPTPALPS